MNATKAVRLPLQIGTSSLWSLTRSSAALLPGLALIPLGIAAAIATKGRYAGIALALAIATCGVLLVVFAWAHIRYAWQDRPSDVILSPEGLRVEGGRFHGLVVPWSLIDRTRTSIRADEEERLTLASIALSGVMTGLLALIGIGASDGIKETIAVHRLVVVRRRGGSVVVAEAERPIEQESLRVLLDSIRADQWYPRPDVEAGTAPPTLGVVACPGCGAAAMPDEAETVTCRYCGALVVIPEEVRRGVRDGRVISHEHRLSERVLARLIDQPGASSTGGLFIAAAVPMLLAWPLAFGLAGREWELGSFQATAAAKLALFASAVILGLFCFLRARLVDRFALRLLTLGFAARSPVDARAPFTCRRCGAPLAEARDSVRVPCAYCGTENLVGLDLGHRAKVETTQAGTLGDALRSRSRERRLWSALGISALALLVPASWLFYSGAKAGLASSGSTNRRPAVEVLASAGGLPIALALDAQAVYWTTHGADRNSGAIMKVPIGGGTPVTLAVGPGPAGIALDEEQVYWADTEEGIIRRVAKAGGASTVLALHQNRPTALACYGGTLFWTNDAPAAGSGDAQGSIVSLRLPAAEPRTIASGQPEPSSLSVDSTGVYWTVRGTPRRRYLDGALLRVAFDRSEPQTLASYQRDPSGVALGETVAFWIDAGDIDHNVVMRAAKRGAGATVLAANQYGTSSLAADDASVYWVSGSGQVLGVAASGGTPRVLADGQTNPVATALDAEHVYWFAQGRRGSWVVARRLK
jgi:hypothetical protein